MVEIRVPKAAPGNYDSPAAQYARLKAAKEATEAAQVQGLMAHLSRKSKTVVERLNEAKEERFNRDWCWVVCFFGWLLFVHGTGIYFFTKGFLLTRLVLDQKSSCASPPIVLTKQFQGAGTPEGGCWHPKIFEKAVVIIIDALRYDFTVPYNTSDSVGKPLQAFHNAIPFMYDTAIREPHNAFLLPFIADPPTTTLQRLKGLTTGTLPAFIDAGSNFAGTAIEEDNLLMQLKDAGKRIVHLGDDTWTALFPGHFEVGMSRAYDSFNVHDLHTVDDGVTEHIIPLLTKDMTSKWDVMIAHFLGVDHAGHRYGPNHFAMTAKLQQMNTLLRDVVASLDDDTLLVVMGDHGMDAKGDHGGESDDEVEAALWMYSRKGIFGRTDPAYTAPPKTAKIRPVDQIDLVPTLAMLLGLPIPFNNIGKPIEEAFAGREGNTWQNMAAAVRMAAAGTQRYQAAYYVARGINESTLSTSEGTPHDLWSKAERSLIQSSKAQMWKDVYLRFTEYQVETLRIFRDLWARFDVPSMALGIAILAASVLSLILWGHAHANDGSVVEDPDLDKAAYQLELDNIARGVSPKDDDGRTGQQAVMYALIGSFAGAAIGAATLLIYFVQYDGEGGIIDFVLTGGSVGGLLSFLYIQIKAGIEGTAVLEPPPSQISGTNSPPTPSKKSATSRLPSTIWGWMAVLFTVSQSLGFASNSFTIWEDSQLLFLISTFGLVTAISSLRIEVYTDRVLGVYHSILFVALGFFASFSKLCREEQMPYCISTYYASATSSTSAPWQLIIPFMLAVGLPSVIKGYYLGSRSYEAFAPLWINWVFRFGLLLSAVYWTLDAADDGEWLNISDGVLKSIRVPISQAVFAIAIGAGSGLFGYAPPCVAISTTAPPTPNSQMVDSQGKTVTILGFANTHGSRYFILIINILLTIIVVQKPMGGGAIALMAWQILSLVEIIDLNSLTSSPIGPVVLALLGSFYFFKTGHQATLASIQWESAFIFTHTIRYPWSPLLIAWNSFGAQILAATAVPLVVLWKQQPKSKGILRRVTAALAWHVAYYAVIGLATTMWAGHLRRHLMLYRIFSPKFMTAALTLLVVDVIGIVVALMGVRWNTLSVAEVFGWG